MLIAMLLVTGLIVVVFVLARASRSQIRIQHTAFTRERILAQAENVLEQGRSALNRNGPPTNGVLQIQGMRIRCVSKGEQVQLTTRLPFSKSETKGAPGPKGKPSVKKRSKPGKKKKPQTLHLIVSWTLKKSRRGTWIRTHWETRVERIVE